MNKSKTFNGGLDKVMCKAPAPWAAWIHQIHVAGGVDSSTTMVVVFVVCLLCVCVVPCVLSGHRHSSYVNNYRNITLRYICLAFLQS